MRRPLAYHGYLTEPPAWSVLSSHGLILVYLARNPRARIRDVALDIGLTERAVGKIIGDLETSGFLTRKKSGRRNVYQFHPRPTLPHPVEAHRQVGDLLRLFLTDEEAVVISLRRRRRV